MHGRQSTSRKVSETNFDPAFHIPQLLGQHDEASAIYAPCRGQYAEGEHGNSDEHDGDQR